MGLLLGDVTVKAAASNFLCFTRHSTCCPPCSKATAMLEVMDKELCFFVQDEPGQGSTAYISAMVPQIRADRRKVQPPLPLCWEGAFVPCEDLIKVATALTPCLSGLCLSEGPSKASAPCLQRAPRPSGCSTHCLTGPRAPAGPRGGQPGAAGRGGGRGRRAQRARRRAHARRRLGAQPPVRPACAARPAAEQLAVQLAAAPASNGACGFPSCCLAGTFTKSNTLAMEARERDFNICLCVLSMRSCRCAPVPASAPAPAGSPRCLARTLAQTGRRTVPAARAGTSPCCPATWTWRRRRRTSSWTRASWGSSWPLLTPCAPRHVAALLALQPAQAARPLRLAALCCPRSPRRQQACQSRGCLAVRNPPGRAGRCSGYKQAYFCSTLTLCPAAGRRRVLAARARDRIPVGAHGGGRAR